MACPSAVTTNSLAAGAVNWPLLTRLQLVTVAGSAALVFNMTNSRSVGVSTCKVELPTSGSSSVTSSTTLTFDSWCAAAGLADFAWAAGAAAITVNRLVAIIRHFRIVAPGWQAPLHWRIRGLPVVGSASGENFCPSLSDLVSPFAGWPYLIVSGRAPGRG